MIPPISLFLSALGLALFIKGFFLHRHELPHVSTCSDVHEMLHNNLHLKESSMSTLTSQGLISSSTSTPPHCWSPALSTVDSAFLVVVDALRFDFASTRLPKLMTHYPPAPGSSSSSTKLYKFVADPPTVTTQRLKGLTTGGLPTFSEITKSFSAGVLVSERSERALMNLDRP